MALAVIFCASEVALIRLPKLNSPGPTAKASGALALREKRTTSFREQTLFHQPPQAIADVQAQIHHLPHIPHPDHCCQNEQQHDREHFGGVDRCELAPAIGNWSALLARVSHRDPPLTEPYPPTVAPPG
jgi:hypothetical protein